MDLRCRNHLDCRNHMGRICLHDHTAPHRQFRHDDRRGGEGFFDDYIRLTGRVEPGTTVQLSALESGIVEKKWVEEGAMVTEGEIILTLHNPNLRQQILDSESQLAEKQNMLRDTEIAMEKDRLQIKQELLSARTTLNQKRRVPSSRKRFMKSTSPLARNT